MARELADAVLRGAVDEAKALLAAGADPRVPAPQYPELWNLRFDYRPAPLLHLAALTGNVEMVRLLLAHGVDINERPSIERSYQTHDDTWETAGDSALRMAVDYGFLVLADALLEAGAALDESTEQALKRARKKP